MRSRRKIKFAFLLTAAFLAAVSLAAIDLQSEVTIESAESKTAGDRPVFNRIRWISLSGQDVWMMNQSHHGPIKEGTPLDRLAIVVDKKKKTARFFQFEPGPLEWTENLPRRNFSVSCFMCHSNGPRAIRPVFDSKDAPVSFSQKMKVAALNFRIKSYGRLHYDPVHDAEDAELKRPFRRKGAIENDPLTVKTCVRCHKEDGLISRGTLFRQNSVTIQSMVERGEMPPFGIEISQAEKQQLNDFLAGF